MHVKDDLNYCEKVTLSHSLIAFNEGLPQFIRELVITRLLPFTLRSQAKILQELSKLSETQIIRAAQCLELSLEL